MQSAPLVPEHSAYRCVMQLAYSVGMTNGSLRQTRRRENLRKLIDEGGGQAQVALEIGTPKSHLSAILAGRRGVGDALALKIERHFGKPDGWLDRDEPEVGGLLPEVSAIAQDINQLPDRQRELVLMAIRSAVALAGTVATETNTDEETPPLRHAG